MKIKFEIQSLIEVWVEANNKEVAREIVIEKLHGGDYNEDLLSKAYVSNGEIE